jgi:hypothetical protein
MTGAVTTAATPIRTALDETERLVREVFHMRDTAAAAITILETAAQESGTRAEFEALDEALDDFKNDLAHADRKLARDRIVRTID